MGDKRFVVIHEEGSSLALKNVILVDTQTGVNYLFVRSGYCSGLTPLLDSEGKVVVTPMR